jgi:hypothetical protein
MATWQLGFVHLWANMFSNDHARVFLGGNKTFKQYGPGSSVGIATSYGLDGPGIESRWGRDFPHLSMPALGPTQPPVQWVPGLSRGVKSGRSVTLTPHPLLVLWSWKGRAIPVLPLWAVRPVQRLSACTGVYFTFSPLRQFRRKLLRPCLAWLNPRLNQIHVSWECQRHVLAKCGNKSTISIILAVISVKS